MKPSSSQDTQIIENLLKTENTKQALDINIKSGNKVIKQKSGNIAGNSRDT